jgi:hypothetical protein
MLLKWDAWSRFIPRLTELLGLQLLLAITTLRVLAIDDLGLWDEAFYLQLGSEQSLTRGEPFVQGGSYFDAYWVLSNVVADPGATYYIMRVATAFMFVFAIWFFARLFVQANLAWAVAAVAVALPVTRSWPGVGNFGASLCLIGLAIMLRFWSPNAFILGSTFVWIAAAARPELTLLAIPITAVTIFVIFKSATGTGSSQIMRIAKAFARTLAALVVPAILILRHGSPELGSERNWVAFTQHFALRNAQLGEDPWVDSAAVAGRYFGTADSVLSALLTNPIAMATHFVKNLVAGPIYFVGSMLPIWWREPGATLLDFVLVFVFLCVLMTVLLIVLARQWREFSYSSIKGLVRSGRFWLILSVIAIALSTIILIYPRIHYFGLLIGLFLVSCVIAIERFGGRARDTNALFVAATILVIVVGASAAIGAIKSFVSPPPLLSSIQLLKNSGNEPILLTADLGLETYIPGLKEVSADLIEGETLGQLLGENQVNLILLNDRLRASPLGLLPDFQTFLDDPNSFGFYQLSNGSEIYVSKP